MTVTIETIEQQSPLLGRQLVHDEQSRAFPLMLNADVGVVDRSTWRDKRIRLYDPLPNPNQAVGCCTGVAKCSQMNAVGNRKTGVVLDMDDAETLYSVASLLDPFPGSWPPTDTGSSGLASAKAAEVEGIGGEYRWIFGGADEVIQSVMFGLVISVGTWWYESMMPGEADAIVHDECLYSPRGQKVGGHQYVIRGYDKSDDLVLGRCWWGENFRDFWLARTDLDDLLRDGGDAHFQVRV